MKTFFVYLNHTEVMISETNKELDARYVRYTFTEANTLNEAALVFIKRFKRLSHRATFNQFDELVINHFNETYPELIL